MTESSKKPKLGIIVGLVGGLIILLFGGLLYFICKRRHKGYKREVFVDVAGLYFLLVMEINGLCWIFPLLVKPALPGRRKKYHWLVKLASASAILYPSFSFLF